MKVTESYLKRLGYKETQVSGSKRNTELAIENWRKKGYTVKVTKGLGTYGKYQKRVIWIKKKKPIQMRVKKRRRRAKK